MSDKLLIKDLLNENKPRERLIGFGDASLSESELLALILQTGGANTSAVDLANLLLKHFGSLKKVFDAEYFELIKLRYIGAAKASKIRAISEVCKRIMHTKSDQLEFINNPESAYKTIKRFFVGKKQEHVYLLSLNSRRCVTSIDLISLGSINESLFPLREIIKKALEKNAVGIIIAHNHPSGDSSPSHEDIEITKNLQNACTAVGLTFIDHIIATETEFTSLKSSNLLSKGGE